MSDSQVAEYCVRSPNFVIQYEKISSYLKPSKEKTMFFSFEPMNFNHHLLFKFIPDKPVKSQIRNFLIQTDTNVDDFEDEDKSKCHFEYRDKFGFWIVLDLNTKIEDFDDQSSYHEIRFRYH